MLRKIGKAKELFQSIPLWQAAGVVVLLIVMVGGLLVLYWSGSEARSVQVTLERSQQENGGEQEAGEVVIYVAGAVACPGVYSLPAGSRVADALRVAGGLLEEADTGQLNLAEKVRDGQKIHVPRVGEAAPTGAGGASGSLVNLNTADARQLEQLPGIGPKLAQSIIEYRDKKGGFRSVEELKGVKGIGPSKLEEIKGLVAI